MGAPGDDGTPDGSQTVVVGTNDVPDNDFSIQQPPTPDTFVEPTQPNPGGMTSVPVDPTDFGGTDPSTGGQIDELHICAFPSNAESITINGTTYTSANWPAAGVTIPTNAAGEPTQAISVNPIDGSVTVGIPYSVTDNGDATSSCTGMVELPFCESITFTDDAVCTGDVFDLTSVEPAGLTGGVWTEGAAAVADATAVDAGTYDYSVTTANGCTITSSIVIDTRIPDYTPTITIAPSAITGQSNVRVIVNISEIAGDPSCSPIYVFIPKDVTRFNFTYESAATVVGGIGVENAAWTYYSSNPVFHVWEYTGAATFAASNSSNFGFIGSYDPSNTGTGVDIPLVDQLSRQWHSWVAMY